MEIVETTGGIVAEGRDSWWSSMLVETAGVTVIVGRHSWSLLLVESAGGCRLW